MDVTEGALAGLDWPCKDNEMYYEEEMSVIKALHLRVRVRILIAEFRNACGDLSRHEERHWLSVLYFGPYLGNVNICELTYGVQHRLLE